MFADDTFLYYSSDNMQEIQNATCINIDLKALNKWSQQWILEFNQEKKQK